MITALLAATLGIAPVPVESVKFHEGTFADALSKAAASKVPVFIDFYTDW